MTNHGVHPIEIWSSCAPNQYRER